MILIHRIGESTQENERGPAVCGADFLLRSGGAFVYLEFSDLNPQRVSFAPDNYLVFSGIGK